MYPTNFMYSQRPSPTTSFVPTISTAPTYQPTNVPSFSQSPTYSPQPTLTKAPTEPAGVSISIASLLPESVSIARLLPEAVDPADAREGTTEEAEEKLTNGSEWYFQICTTSNLIVLIFTAWGIVKESS